MPSQYNKKPISQLARPTTRDAFNDVIITITGHGTGTPTEPDEDGNTDGTASTKSIQSMYLPTISRSDTLIPGGFINERSENYPRGMGEIDSRFKYNIYSGIRYSEDDNYRGGSYFVFKGITGVSGIYISGTDGKEDAQEFHLWANGPDTVINRGSVVSNDNGLEFAAGIQNGLIELRTIVGSGDIRTRISENDDVIIVEPAEPNTIIITPKSFDGPLGIGEIGDYNRDLTEIDDTTYKMHFVNETIYKISDTIKNPIIGLDRDILNKNGTSAILITNNNTKSLTFGSVGDSAKRLAIYKQLGNNSFVKGAENHIFMKYVSGTRNVCGDPGASASEVSPTIFYSITTPRSPYFLSPPSAGQRRRFRESEELAEVARLRQEALPVEGGAKSYPKFTEALGALAVPMAVAFDGVDMGDGKMVYSKDGAVSPALVYARGMGLTQNMLKRVESVAVVLATPGYEKKVSQNVNPDDYKPSTGGADKYDLNFDAVNFTITPEVSYMTPPMLFFESPIDGKKVTPIDWSFSTWYQGLWLKGYQDLGDGKGVKKDRWVVRSFNHPTTPSPTLGKYTPLLTKRSDIKFNASATSENALDNSDNFTVEELANLGIFRGINFGPNTVAANSRWFGLAIITNPQQISGPGTPEQAGKPYDNTSVGVTDKWEYMSIAFPTSDKAKGSKKIPNESRDGWTVIEEIYLPTLIDANGNEAAFLPMISKNYLRGTRDSLNQPKNSWITSSLGDQQLMWNWSGVATADDAKKLAKVINSIAAIAAACEGFSALRMPNELAEGIGEQFISGPILDRKPVDGWTSLNWQRLGNLGAAKNRSAFAARLTGHGGTFSTTVSTFWSDGTFVIPSEFITIRLESRKLKSSNGSGEYSVYDLACLEIADTYKRFGRSSDANVEIVQGLDVQRCLANRLQVKFSTTKAGSKFDRI
tara:strand:+ start:20917 stop:23703 length:2787 start_codon:yes stop_codon:yes gene_type:complete